MPYGIVYIAFNTTNGKSYVGQTVQTLDARRKMHRRKRSCRFFRNALEKHGDAFVWSVLTECNNQDDLNRAEAYWVQFLDTIAPNGYNLTHGGGAGGRRSEETKRRLREVFAREDVKARRSKVQKEIHARPEVVTKNRLTWLGKKRTDEDRRKMSERKLAKKYRWKLDASGRRIYWSEVNENG